MQPTHYPELIVERYFPRFLSNPGNHVLFLVEAIGAVQAVALPGWPKKIGSGVTIVLRQNATPGR
jgi:hypothetical protein